MLERRSRRLCSFPTLVKLQKLFDNNKKCTHCLSLSPRCFLGKIQSNQPPLSPPLFPRSLRPILNYQFTIASSSSSSCIFNIHHSLKSQILHSQSYTRNKDFDGFHHARDDQHQPYSPSSTTLFTLPLQFTSSLTATHQSRQ